MHNVIATFEEFYIICISPDSGVVDDIVATGPEPAFVFALILKLYEVKGVRLSISTEVASAFSTKISRIEEECALFLICTVYPVMTTFCLSFGTGVHESIAVVGSL